MRYEIKHNDKGLAFGNDHACGEFLMIWIRPSDEEERKRQDLFGPDPDEVIVDEDKITGLTQEKAKQLVTEHGFTWEEMYETKRHYEDDDIERALFDLGF